MRNPERRSHYFGSTPPAAYFRPDRKPSPPARAEAAKDGRRSVGDPRSPASRPLLDGREHDGTLARSGTEGRPTPTPLSYSGYGNIKVRERAYAAPMIPQLVQTMRAPDQGTGTSSGHASAGSTSP